MSTPAPPDYRGLLILEELEQDLRGVFEAGPVASRPATGAASDDHGRTRARRAKSRRRDGRSRSATFREPGRRAAVLAGVLVLVGATALAERTIDRGEQVNTQPALLGAAQVDGERWEMRAYRHDGDLCQAFVVDGEVVSACGSPPVGASARATSVLGPGSRYVVGLAAPAATIVDITVGEHRTSVQAEPVSASVQRSARLPEGLRWFVARFPVTPGTRDAPARLVARGRDGERLGRALLDCSLGQASRPCLAAAQRRADPSSDDG